jgi:hydroxymethylbilane synthase
LLAWRKDWKVVDLRGNLDTRIRKLLEGQVDAIVVAGAGLRRLKIKNEELRIKPLSFAIMLPAAGQGALAIEIRKKDPFLSGLIAGLKHRATEIEVTAERSLLQALGGGCQVPIGAYAKLTGRKLKLQGMLATPDGKKLVRANLAGEKNYPEELGIKLAKKLSS